MPQSAVEELQQEFQNQAEETKVWKPISDAQQRFLSTPAFEALFGGAAYGGKSTCLVMDALRQIEHPQYRAAIFRRTYGELEDADGPIQRSHEWYPELGGRYYEGKRRWVFPSGAIVYFHHMEHPEHRYKYKSAQYQYIAFDETSSFTEAQYRYLFSRCRTDKGSGLKCYMRGGTNPGGEGHVFLKERFISRGITNEIGWFKEIDDVDTRVPAGTPGALSRIFIPSNIFDNPLATDQYVAQLMSLDPVERDRLLHGDWDAEFSDQIYDNWSSEENVANVEYDPNYPVEWWVDDGYANPRVILVVQERPYRGVPDAICIIDEYHVTREQHAESIEAVLDMPYPTPDLAIVDPSAVYMMTTLGNFDITHMPGYNDIIEGIKGVRRYICDESGVRSLFVNPRCKHTINDIPRYRNGSGEKRGEPSPAPRQEDHTLDAIRYGIATFRMWSRE